MREFKLLRYFKKWWWLVVVISLVCGAGVCKYALDKRAFVAQTVLAYTNKEAETGLTPNGLAIDPGEVRSAWVIARALEDAGISESVDRVRSRVSYTEVIPDDVAAVQKAAWADGLDYDYYPTEYVISYNSGTNASADEARAVLEAIVDSYYHYYGKQYVNAALLPSSLSAMLAIAYDDVELVEALDGYVQEMLAYVTANAGYSPAFRSSLTGYSFADMVSEYTLLQENVLPSLYARVIGGHVTENRDVLLMKYRKRVADNDIQIANLETRAQDIREMIAAFVEKNQESMDYHWNLDDLSAAGVTRGSNYVLGQVYEFQNGKYDNEQTTYDALLLQYVSNNDQIETLKVDNTYCGYILAAYDGAVSAEEADAKEARAALDDFCLRLTALESALSGAQNEYMEYRAAQNLAITSTVNVYATMNVKLYIALAFLLFFLVGCVGAVVLGRGEDFAEYILNTDHVSNLPNRRRCDMMIDRYSQRPVEPPFSCVYLAIDNLMRLNMTRGYKGGSEAIAAVSRLLTLCAQDFGFIGYNDGGRFIGLFEGCDADRAAYFLTTFQSALDACNKERPESPVVCRGVYASAGREDALTARDLLRACVNQMGKPA